MQDGYVECYESWKLEHKNNYTIHDLELETRLHSLKVWRHYLLRLSLFSLGKY